MAITPFKLLRTRASDAGLTIETSRTGPAGGYRYEIRRAYRRRVLATYQSQDLVQAWLSGMDEDFKAFLHSIRK